ncbi:MAG: glycosyltransferase [Patescibacteria group bacterium]
MKLLLFTQALDTNDPVLSVYHRWVIEFAKHFEFITVVCLKVGKYNLPGNVKVLSLGKEEGIGRFGYVMRFYKYIFDQKYDTVFVHMNQEYLLLGGIFWKMMGKRVYMWRNHHGGSFLTDIAVTLCTKIFCTSKFSYTAKYKKTSIMPVGVDTDFFVKLPAIKKIERSILFLSRIAPVKKPHVLIEVLKILKTRQILFVANVYGDSLDKDKIYHENLKKNVREAGLSDSVTFYGGIPNTETVKTYNNHEIFVNLSSSGMYDKTIFEAMACETLTLATNKNLEELVPKSFIAEENDVENIALKLEKLLALSNEEKAEWGRELRRVAVERHSLRELGNKITTEIV